MTLGKLMGVIRDWPECTVETHFHNLSGESMWLALDLDKKQEKVCLGPHPCLSVPWLADT